VFSDSILLVILIVDMSLPTTAGLYHLDTPAGLCEARIFAKVYFIS